MYRKEKWGKIVSFPNGGENKELIKLEDDKTKFFNGLLLLVLLFLHQEASSSNQLPAVKAM